MMDKHQDNSIDLWRRAEGGVTPPALTQIIVDQQELHNIDDPVNRPSPAAEWLV